MTPDVRFKGFEESWNILKVGNISDISIGEFIIKTKQSDFNKYPVYNGGITNTGFYDKWNTPENKIVISARGANVGYVNLVKEKYWAGNSCYSLDFNLENFSLDFIFNALINSKEELSEKLQSANIPSLSKMDVFNINIKCPTYQEQSKIGELFKNIDNLITQTTTKLDKLKDVKKSLLNKMFPREGKLVPEIRFKAFSENWKKFQFSEISSIDRGSSPRPIEKYLTDNHTGINWIKIGDAPENGIFIDRASEKITKDGVKFSRFVNNGNLILSNSMSFGKSFILNINGCIHDGWLYFRKILENMSLVYIAYYLRTENMFNEYIKLSNGSVVNNLNKDIVLNSDILAPVYAEQSKIAEFLTAVDKLITLTNKKLTKLKEIKKALLQKMFV